MSSSTGSVRGRILGVFVGSAVALIVVAVALKYRSIDKPVVTVATPRTDVERARDRAYQLGVDAGTASARAGLGIPTMETLNGLSGNFSRKEAGRDDEGFEDLFKKGFETGYKAVTQKAF